MAKEYELEKVDVFNVFTQFNSMLNNNEELSTISEYLFELCLKKNRAMMGMVVLKSNGEWVVTNTKGFNITDLNIKHAKDDLLMIPELKAFLNAKNLRFSYDIKYGDNLMGKIFLDRQDLINLKDKKFLVTLLSYAGVYLHNKSLEVELKNSKSSIENKVEQLSSLFDLSKEFSGMLEVDLIGKLLIFSIISQFMVSKFAVVIFTEDDMLALESKYKIDITDLLRVYDYRNFDFTLLRKDIENRYSTLAAEDVELIIPMQIKGETKGLLVIGSLRNDSGFSKLDVEYLEALGSLAIIAIENANLFKEAVEKQKMEKDLETARNIQKNLLPQTFPQVKYADIHAINISAKQVGGDYYEIIQLDEDRVLFAIADVAGKGVQAALLMANLQAFIKSICKQNLPLDIATNMINDLVAENVISGSYITFFWGIINNKKREITYVNAGHNPPLFIRNKEIKKLSTGGLILGMMKTMLPYQSETIKIKKNDAIIMFTDGITEAMNKDEVEFSDEKVEELCLKNYTKPAQHQVNILLKNIDEFTKGAEQSDDITCVILKVR